MPPPLVLTGASGFIGRHLLAAVQERFEVVALARRSRARCGIPAHPNLAWFQVDIAEREPLAAVFEAVRGRARGAAVVHLAAHYDFSGCDHPEYWRTNVVGTRNVLELASALAPRRVVFASSVAACSFPPPGRAIDETTPPDASHVYARSKRAGEELLRALQADFPAAIVRFAAVYSDWCEYAPLHAFLETWLSRAWNRRLLAGQGRAAIPYLHVRDAVAFVERLLACGDALERLETLVASPDGSVSQRLLFHAATLHEHGVAGRPLLLPRWLCGLGVRLRDGLGRFSGRRPFERTWMLGCIDRALWVSAERTRRRLGWAPRRRLLLPRRLPFLLENRRADPLEWQRRNHAARRETRVPRHLFLAWLLEQHQEAVLAACLAGAASAAAETAEERRFLQRLLLHQLVDAVRANDPGGFMAFCRDLAERRRAECRGPADLCADVERLRGACRAELARDPRASGLGREIASYVDGVLRLGCDEWQDVLDLDREG